MWKDEIVEQVRQAREAHAARFNFDLDAIYADLKRQEQSGGCRVVRRVLPGQAVKSGLPVAPLMSRNPPTVR